MTTPRSDRRFDWKRLPRPFSALAPMSDVTDTVFRRLLVAWGPPDVLFTEFISADGLCSAGARFIEDRLDFHPEEWPLVVQLWGRNPEAHYRTVQRLVEMGFQGVDLNMGCPAQKVIKKGCCSALIENRSLAAELIQATQEAAAGRIPVSIKTRLGFHRRRTEDWTEFLLSFDPDALIMHGRLARDMSRVPADWDEIAKVVAVRDALGRDTVIVGNGDVRSYAEIREKHERTGVDGVMVGRGLFHNPLLFRSDGASIDDLSTADRLRMLLQHVELFAEVWGQRRSYATLKRFFKIYVAGFPGAAHWRNDLMQSRTLAEGRRMIEALLEDPALPT